MKDNIVLIGMPGAGKSTIGVILAKVLGKDFIDADLVIQKEEGRLLSRIIEEEGPEGFLRIEERINKGLNPKQAVIATGGSDPIHVAADLLSQAEHDAWNEADELTRAAAEKWEAQDAYLHVTLRHADTDSIYTSFREVEEFLESREQGEYSAANARLIALMGLDIRQRDTVLVTVEGSSEEADAAFLERFFQENL